MKFTIKTSLTSNQTISLHSNILEELLLKDKKEILLNFGSIQKNVTIKKHDDNISTIYISIDLCRNISIPEFVEYEIRFKNDVLYIGPIIGLLIRGKIEEMNDQRIKIYKNYLIDYKHINGLILLFTIDGINEQTKTITGYAYNPMSNEWIKGLFPFPSVVFIRRTIKDVDREVLHKIIGNKYFNSHIFNKWDMWEWFSKDKKLRNYLPKTVLGTNIMNIKMLLEEYNHIFIKPISGMQGTGIFQLSNKENEYHLSYRIKGKNITTILESWEDVGNFIVSELKLNKYIAQQRIPLQKKEKRVMDFRVIVIKDQYGHWNVPGMVTKYGEENSIVSNISSGGSAEKVWDTLQQIYKHDIQKAFKMYINLEKLAILCCKSLEEKGLHLGYIGIDIGIDEDENLWIIEINHRSPDMTIALDAKDRQLYYKVKSAPLHYAKWLSGFGGVVNGTI